MQEANALSERLGVAIATPKGLLIPQQPSDERPMSLECAKEDAVADTMAAHIWAEIEARVGILVASPPMCSVYAVLDCGNEIAAIVRAR